MLHMIVNTHNAESCAFRGDEEGRLLTGAFDKFDQGNGTDDVRVVGSWVNKAAHEIFMLVEAPNANVIDEALLSAGLIGRTHSRVLSVMPTKDVEVAGRDQAARMAGSRS